MDYRLIHFNCARPVGSFATDNPFVRVFLALLPRIFAEADKFDGLYFHAHGLRCPDGSWRGFSDAFPYPEDWAAPDICTLAVWRSIEDLKAFAYSGRTHPPGMRRLAGDIDRSEGPGFVMWWAPASHRATLAEGWDRLQRLRTEGPSPEAFTLEAPTARPHAA